MLREEVDQFALLVLTEQLVSLTGECRGLGYCLYRAALYTPLGQFSKAPAWGEPRMGGFGMRFAKRDARFG